METNTKPKQGQCGTTSDFCTISNSTTNAPGTAAPKQNGCISNCGTDIVNNGSPPSEYMNIAYFEGFNWGRRCLNMEATSIPTSYTHVHFGFANLTQDYDIDLGDQTIQWDLFVSMTAFKRILSIGGWAFSTDPSTYSIFRDGVNSDNRATLVSNIVAFVKKYNLDGIDIDWEYPGKSISQPWCRTHNSPPPIFFIFFTVGIRMRFLSNTGL